MEIGEANEAICRVCRCEGTWDNPLFHPCKCTGSIKWIHQDCLLQWIHYSKKKSCELCRYRFSFAPIYAPNTPERLPLTDVLDGLFNNMRKGFKFWMRCTMVIVCWLGYIPMFSTHMFRIIFTKHENVSAAVYNLMTIPPHLLTFHEDCIMDIIQGTFIVSFMIVAFIGVFWLREQVLLDNDPDWNNARNPPINVPPEGEENEDHNMDLLENNENHVQPARIGNIPAAPVVEPLNWNLMDLERAAEDITWERLLGLDGSYTFLAPLTCMQLFTTLFIILFVSFPHHLGMYFVEMFRLTKYVKAIQFEGFIHIVLGYFVSGCSFYLLSLIASLMSLERLRKLSKLTYLIIKASLLMVLEFIVLPIVAGWWLDVCTLTIFSGTLSDRLSAFVKFPVESTSVHWLAGIVFAYYVTTFILLLRDVLRPGIFWFFPLVNNPDYSPIQGMIRMSLFTHVAQIMVLAMVFGITVMLMLFVPGRILRRLAPTFLPFPVYDSLWNVYELSRVLFFLLPALLEEEHLRLWARIFIRKWCWEVGKLLNLHIFLLGNVEEQNERERAAAENDNMQHDALQQPVEHVVEEPPRPNYFWIRLFMFLAIFCLTLVAGGLIMLTLPFYVKKCFWFFWPNSSESALDQETTETYGSQFKARINTLCNSTVFTIWIQLEIFGIVRHWRVPTGADILKMIKTFTVIVFKTIMVSFWLIGVIPVLLGLLIELMFMIPLKIPNGQTPIMNVTIAWAFGFLPLNIAIAAIMIGPNSKLKRSIDRTFENGFRGIDLKLTVVNTAIPISLMLCLMLAVPYVIAYSIIPFIVWDFKTRCLIARRIYPIILFLICTSTALSIVFRQFVNLHERLKNEKYLVGQRLVNYNH